MAADSIHEIDQEKAEQLGKVEGTTNEVSRLLSRPKSRTEVEVDTDKAPPLRAS